MKYHELADIFPLMEGEEYEQLKEDIRKNGLLEPIYLYQKKILDGRNRYRACKELGIAAKYVVYEGDNPLSFVISMNLHRRHLNAYQRAKIVLKLKPKFREKAREKQGTRTDLKKTDFCQNSDKSYDIKKELAKLADISHDTIAKVETIEQKAPPELKKKLESGEKTIHSVYKEIKRKEKLENNYTPDLPEGKYFVIYADPPWDYNNSGFDESAQSKYPTMPTKDICELPIENLTGDRAVLFLWVTNAFLEDGLQVCRAWGFKYKTNLVWIKNKGPSIGWFTKSRHELLFIATKGDGVHPIEKMNSWFEGEVSEHSKKPDKVYDMIEKMYPGPYIELFARNIRKGWDSWGNQIPENKNSEKD